MVFEFFFLLNIYFWGEFYNWCWSMNTVIRYINHFLINLVVYENESTINKKR